MTLKQYAVILVHSTNHAIRVEKLLQQASIPCKLIPVPRQLSSDCGVCVRVLCADAEQVRRLIQEARVDIQDIRAI